MTDMKPKQEIHIFNMIFSALGVVLLGVAGWIATSVAHLPAIEQKMDDFIAAAGVRFTGTDSKLAEHEKSIADHEVRIRVIEGKPHK